MFIDTGNTLSFTMATVAMTLTPGLATALILQAASKHGVKAALATSWGIVAAISFWGIVASFGLGTFLLHYPEAFLWLRRIGSLYLAFLGLKIFYSSLKEGTSVASDDVDGFSTSKSMLSYAWDALAVMIFNPEIGVFDATFFPQFMTDQQDILSTGLLYTAIEAVLALVWQGVLGGLTSSWPIWRHPRFRVYADRLFGIVLLFLAFKGWK